MEAITDEYLTSICEYFPSWKQYSSQDVIFQKMPFGNSSDTYKVENPNHESLLFRKFKANVTGYVDNDMRKRESCIFSQLSDLGIGPKLYGGNKEFRIEHYYDSRPIKSTEINDPIIRKNLAVKLGLFNSLTNVQVEDYYFFERFYSQEIIIQNFNTNILKLDGFSEYEKEEYSKLKYLGSDEEMNLIRKLISKSQKKVVFSHNDIWCGNILFLPSSYDVIFIDYEQVGYNFLGYDIGKLLLETIYERKDDSPDFTINEKYFPSEDDMKSFLRYYNIAFHHNLFSTFNNCLTETDVEKYEEVLYVSKDDKERQLNSLLQDTYLGMLMSCHYMAYMGVLVGKTLNAIDFVNFAIESHRLYLKFKALIKIE